MFENLFKKPEKFGFCFNCGTKLDKNYSPIMYNFENGQAEFARLCEYCANILDGKEQMLDIEPEDDK